LPATKEKEEIENTLHIHSLTTTLYYLAVFFKYPPSISLLHSYHEHNLEIRKIKMTSLIDALNLKILVSYYIIIYIISTATAEFFPVANL